jgi:hypothetical protein
MFYLSTTRQSKITGKTTNMNAPGLTLMPNPVKIVGKENHYLDGYKIGFIYIKNPKMKLLAQNWLWMKI